MEENKEISFASMYTGDGDNTEEKKAIKKKIN